MAHRAVVAIEFLSLGERLGRRLHGIRLGGIFGGDFVRLGRRLWRRLILLILRPQRAHEK